VNVWAGTVVVLLAKNLESVNGLFTDHVAT
jgi:hypothetical protein